MLIFKKLTLENFGPYVGVQELNFPSNNGIILIRARNGRGKTTILNALRFVLFGSIKTVKMQNVDLAQYLNLISRNSGNFRYKVILSLELDGKSYELTRVLTPKPGILVPETMNDYEFPEAVIKETSSSGEQRVLLDLEVKNVLNQIMDEHVARFYLFDGELLKEYESQLMGEQDIVAAKIKEGIENILGVPILTNAHEHVELCLGQYIHNFESIVQSNKKTEDLGKAINGQNKKAETYKHDIKSLNNDLSEIRAQLAYVQNKLEQSSENQDIIKEQAKLEKDIENLNKEINDKKEERSLELQSTWKKLLIPVLQEKNEEIFTKIQNLDTFKKERDVREKVIRELKISLKNDRCELCNQPLDAEAAKKLQTLLEEYNSIDETEIDLENTVEELPVLQTQSKYIDEFVWNNSSKDINTLESEIRSLDTKLIFFEKDLDEINQEIKSMNLTLQEFQILVEERDELKQKESSTTMGLEATIKKLADTEDMLKKLEIQLNNVSKDGEVEKAKYQRNFVNNLSEIISDGISLYRDDLKSRVEKDATDLFIKLSEEKEYERLRINDNYGLEIIHEDGNAIPLRSSGYEHLVAFSLIGALHKNAPLQGPLFMDTSFGRLDKENSRNLIRVLPYLSEQVILLVHDREIDEELVRNLIPNAIKAKYQIERISARESHLKLVERGE